MSGSRGNRSLRRSARNTSSSDGDSSSKEQTTGKEQQVTSSINRNGDVNGTFRVGDQVKVRRQNRNMAGTLASQHDANVWTVRFGKDDTERFHASALSRSCSEKGTKRRHVRRPECVKYKLKTGTLYLYNHSHQNRRVEFVRRV